LWGWSKPMKMCHMTGGINIQPAMTWGTVWVPGFWRK
jgi:hypothetical protein